MSLQDLRKYDQPSARLACVSKLRDNGAGCSEHGDSRAPAGAEVDRLLRVCGGGRQRTSVAAFAATGASKQESPPGSAPMGFASKVPRHIHATPAASAGQGRSLYKRPPLLECLNVARVDQTARPATPLRGDMDGPQLARANPGERFLSRPLTCHRQSAAPAQWGRFTTGPWSGRLGHGVAPGVRASKSHRTYLDTGPSHLAAGSPRREGSDLA